MGTLLSRMRPLELYAIYRALPTTFGGLVPGAEWIVVMGGQIDQPQGPSYLLVYSLIVERGKIVGENSACSGPQEPGIQVSPDYESVEFLVPPP